jgi:hypothetical protein
VKSGNLRGKKLFEQVGMFSSVLKTPSDNMNSIAFFAFVFLALYSNKWQIIKY